MRRRVTVLGAALAGSGYPNARNTVSMLADMHQVEPVDRASWLPGDVHLWKLARGTWRERLRIAWLLGSRNLLALCRLARHVRPRQWVYLPYPSLPALWCLSWLPVRWRPRGIADAYITLWDTLYQDRKLGSTDGWASRLLLQAEARALRAAHAIVVDTQANADHLCQLFGVPRDRVHAFPLAVDAATLPTTNTQPGFPTATAAPHQRCRVLFIGTFVPLQGTEVIAQAITLLREQADIEFVLIGDGQQADTAALLLAGHPRLTWLRGWQPPSVLAAELARADICLGVFGGSGKAARVLPFKLYMAMAAGKAIITQHEYSLPDDCSTPPVLTCVAEPAALASCIIHLCADHTLRTQLASDARHYFEAHLSNSQLAARWQALLSR